MSRAVSKPPAKPENVVAMQGGLHRVVIDYEGESKVTFSIPLSSVDEVVRLSKWTKKTLTIYVKREAEGT